MWWQTYSYFPGRIALQLPHSRCSFPIPQTVGGWVGLRGWLYTKIVYSQMVTDPSTNRARRTATSLIRPMPLTLGQPASVWQSKDQKCRNFLNVLRNLKHYCWQAKTVRLLGALWINFPPSGKDLWNRFFQPSTLGLISTCLTNLTYCRLHPSLHQDCLHRLMSWAESSVLVEFLFLVFFYYFCHYRLRAAD